MGKKRRGRGEGGLRQLKSGSWRASVSFGFDPATGERLREFKVFKLKADAIAWRDERKRRGPAAPADLNEWLTDWLKLQKVEREASTYSTDSYTADKYIRPRLGAVKLRDLTPLHCSKFLADLHEAGVSDSERHRAGAVLRKCLNRAVRLGKLSASPMHRDRVSLPGVERAEWVALDAGQLAAILEAAKGRGLEACVRVWADAGVRVGELLGLQWQDWDAAARELTVRRAVCPVTGKLKQTKTKRIRRVILGVKAAAALAGHRAAARLGEDTSPIFPAHSRTRPAVGHQRTGNFTNRYWTPLLAAAGLAGKGITPRSLRHTCASHALRNGASLRAVADRLGHKDPALTLRVYAHCLPGDQHKVAEIMDGLM